MPTLCFSKPVGGRDLVGPEVRHTCRPGPADGPAVRPGCVGAEGLLPPGFGGAAQPRRPGLEESGVVRRSLALTCLWGVLWIGVFSPLATLGQATEIDLSSVSTPQLFSPSFPLCAGLMIWYVLGFAGVPGFGSVGRNGWVAQFGFRASSIWREIGIGLVVGVGAWVAVLMVLTAPWPC